MSSFGEFFRSSLRRSLRFFRRCGMKRDGKGGKNRRSGCLYGIGFRRTISGCVFGAVSSCPPPRRRKDTAGRFGGYAKVGALMFWNMETDIFGRADFEAGKSASRSVRSAESVSVVSPSVRAESLPVGPRRSGASSRHGRPRRGRLRLRAGRSSGAGCRMRAVRKDGPGCR